ncbi:MAG TPA: type IV secretion system DNA-binding domain-containing protein [Solirubrobacteraceae bacterium]|jgi:hypothetical protein|nr:type IV secretion system DNA-binding domain-containing protein [Solirubrobacteraceae bacterium]
MPRSTEPTLANEPNLNQEMDPLMPLEHLLRWLTGAILHIVLGVLLGLLAAYLMRRRHLHWSWAAATFALALLVRAALAGSASTLAVAALAAAVRGRRWHREDLRAGADLADIAAARTGPLDALRDGQRSLRTLLSSRGLGSWSAVLAAMCGVCRWALPNTLSPATGGRGERSRWLHWDARSWWFRGEQLTVGEDRHGRPVSIELGGADSRVARCALGHVGGGADTDIEGDGWGGCHGGTHGGGHDATHGSSHGGTHTLVVGATGSGKTVTQTWILTRAIAHGMAALVVDPKGDPMLREQVRRAALAVGRRLIVWTPEGPSVYNPYARGGETEIADKVLAGERFTEPHYLRQAQRYLGHAVRTLRAAGREVSLAGLVEMLDPARLELLAREIQPGSAEAVHAYLDSLTPRQRSELTGVRDRLAIMAESDVGPWLDPSTPNAESFDVLESVRAGAVVYIGLQADSRPLLTHMLGSAIVQDLQTAASALQSHPVRCVVVIDEFAALAAEHVGGLFGRARSAGMSLVLGAQELSDLRLPGRETLLEQVLGNLTSVIAHRQVVPDSAELIARLAGSRGAWRTTLSSHGHETRTRVSEHLIGSEEVMGLPRGHAAVIRLAGRRGAAIARMHSPEQGL